MSCIALCTKCRPQYTFFCSSIRISFSNLAVECLLLLSPAESWDDVLCSTGDTPRSAGGQNNPILGCTSEKPWKPLLRKRHAAGPGRKAPFLGRELQRWHYERAHDVDHRRKMPSREAGTIITPVLPRPLPTVIHTLPRCRNSGTRLVLILAQNRSKKNVILAHSTGQKTQAGNGMTGEGR